VDIKHPWSKELEQKLRQVFKLPKFRMHQKEAIDETMAGKDGQSNIYSMMRSLTLSVFVLMPTGGGKSLTCKNPLQQGERN
jgi:bloom syndrome protein